MDQRMRNNDSLHSLYTLNDPIKDIDLQNVLIALHQLEITVENMTISFDDIDQVLKESNFTDQMVQIPQRQPSTTSVKIDDNKMNSFNDDDDDVFIVDYYDNNDSNNHKKAIDSIKKELEDQFKKTTQFLPSFESFQRSVMNQKHLPQIKIQDKIEGGICSSQTNITSGINNPSAALQMAQNVTCCTSEIELQHKLRPDGPTQYIVAGPTLPTKPSSTGMTPVKKTILNQCSIESPLRNALQAKTTLHQTNKKKPQPRKRKFKAQEEVHNTQGQNTAMSLNVQNTRKRFAGETNYLSAHLATNYSAINGVVNANNSKVNTQARKILNSTSRTNQVSYELRKRLAEPNIYDQPCTSSYQSLDQFTSFPTSVNPAQQSYEGYGANSQNHSGVNYQNSTYMGYSNFPNKENKSTVIMSKDDNWSFGLMQRSTSNCESYKTIKTEAAPNSHQGNYSGYNTASFNVNDTVKPNNTNEFRTEQDAMSVYNYGNQFKSEYGTGQQISSDNGTGSQITCALAIDHKNNPEYRGNQQMMSSTGPVHQIISEADQQIKSKFESTHNGSGSNAFENYETCQKNMGNFGWDQSNNYYGTGTETAWNSQNNCSNFGTGQFPYRDIKTEFVDMFDWDKERTSLSSQADQNYEINSLLDTSIEADFNLFQPNSSTHEDESIQNSFSCGGQQQNSSEFKTDSEKVNTLTADCEWSTDTMFGNNNSTSHGATQSNNLYPVNQTNMQLPYQNAGCSQSFGKSPMWAQNLNMPQIHNMNYSKKLNLDADMKNNPWFYE